MADLPNFRDDDALLPVAVQDAATGRVLMLAYMNREAWDATVATGEAVYYLSLIHISEPTRPY